MNELNDIYKKYEGVGIPYRGRCDDISRIVRVFSVNLSENNNKFNKSLVNDFLIYKYVNDIYFNDSGCITIDYIDEFKKSVSFSTVPDNLKSKFYDSFYDSKCNKYVFSGKCHSVVLKFLEMYPSSRFKAITSVCVNVNNFLYFHSYLLDVDSNKVVDFCNNLIMDKDEYDDLFCYREINCFSYDQVVSALSEKKYCVNKHRYLSLLYLALDKLSNSDIKRHEYIRL